jgi:hypothetical protein
MADSLFPEHAGKTESNADSNKKSEQDKEKRIGIAELVGGVIAVGIGCAFTEVELHYWALLFYWISVSCGIDGLAKLTARSKKLWWGLMLGNLLIFGLIADFLYEKSPIPRLVLYWMLFAAAIAYAASGWILFFWTLRGLKAIKNQISSDVPFKVSDDFEFQPSDGYYIDCKSKLRVCPVCLLPPTRMVIHLHHSFETDEFERQYSVWKCRQCSSSYLRNDDTPTENADDPTPF